MKTIKFLAICMVILIPLLIISLAISRFLDAKGKVALEETKQWNILLTDKEGNELMYHVGADSERTISVGTEAGITVVAHPENEKLFTESAEQEPQLEQIGLVDQGKSR